MSHAQKTKTVLTVEDSKPIRHFIDFLLRREGYSVQQAQNLSEARQILQKNPVNLTVLDLGLPDGCGLDLIPDIKRKNGHSRIIILTVRNDRETKKMAFNLGADAFLTKPFEAEELISVLT